MIRNKLPYSISADDFPVLAFTGAPAAFPVQPENLALAKFFQWNEQLNLAAERFIREKLERGPFVGIHLRNGIDWVSVRVVSIKINVKYIVVSLINAQ